MAILATFKSDHGTVLAFTSFDISVINKFPLCVLQLDFKVAQESGHVKLSNGQYSTSYFSGYPVNLDAWFG
ncbi:MAG: hypothetical protein B2I17_00125 [Thermoplasmatales archaeon B_DKE]|nr:MAG: hypothetical protein B2I17_00125 [Thermoplasmatales archaeon B_DKE]